eukprot:COSAG01_NODE_2116_length_8385_cov_15.810886_6_plen_219_part_00
MCVEGAYINRPALQRGPLPPADSDGWCGCRVGGRGGRPQAGSQWATCVGGKLTHVLQHALRLPWAQCRSLEQLGRDLREVERMRGNGPAPRARGSIQHGQQRRSSSGSGGGGGSGGGAAASEPLLLQSPATAACDDGGEAVHDGDTPLPVWWLIFISLYYWVVQLSWSLLGGIMLPKAVSGVGGGVPQLGLAAVRACSPYIDAHDGGGDCCVAPPLLP